MTAAEDRARDLLAQVTDPDAAPAVAAAVTALDDVAVARIAAADDVEPVALDGGRTVLVGEAARTYRTALANHAALAACPVSEPAYSLPPEVSE